MHRLWTANARVSHIPVSVTRASSGVQRGHGQTENVQRKRDKLVIRMQKMCDSRNSSHEVIRKCGMARILMPFELTARKDMVVRLDAYSSSERRPSGKSSGGSG